MKKKYLAFLCLQLLILTKSYSQLAPASNLEFCPSTNIQFTYTRTGQIYTFYTGFLVHTSTASVSTVYNSITNKTVFTFTANFQDVSLDHSFRIYYEQNNATWSETFTFSRVKSLVGAFPPQLPFYSINAPRCQITNTNISFTKMKWRNTTTMPAVEFGEISEYEYSVPAGWSVNGSVSTGVNDIKLGTNIATITSNLSTTGEVKVRAANKCAPNLVAGPWAVITISRNRPTLSITGDDFICSGSKNYTITGTLPPGATVCWSSSNSNIGSVPSSPNNCGTSKSVTYVVPGLITLTATVTDCMETYSVTKDILIGATVSGYYRIHSDYHYYGIFNPLYNNNSPIWLPANKGFGVDIWLNSPGIQSATWSRDGTSYPFTWNTSGTFLSFSGTSGATAYVERKGIFNLTAQTVCGTFNSTYNWPVVVQGWGSFQVTTSPNPATDLITINISEESPEAKALSKEENVIIEIYTLNQSRLIKQWKLKNDQNRFSLNVANLQKGNYILVVKKGKFKESKQVLIGK